MPNLATILAAIQALIGIGEAAPAVIQLINEVKTLFGSEDQATIDAALAQLDAAADAQHSAAQTDSSSSVSAAIDADTAFRDAGTTWAS